MTGVFTGSYAMNPFTNEAIPVWISEYVLAGYGTGAIMAVPAHDSRDYAFARKFNLPVIPVIDNGQPIDLSKSSYDAKEGKMINSGLIDGMEVKKLSLSSPKKWRNGDREEQDQLPPTGCHFQSSTVLGRTVSCILQRQYALYDR